MAIHAAKLKARTKNNTLCGPFMDSISSCDSLFQRLTLAYVFLFRIGQLFVVVSVWPCVAVLPFATLLRIAGVLPFAAMLCFAGILLLVVLLRIAGVLPFTVMLRFAAVLPLAALLRIAGMLPFAVMLRFAVVPPCRHFAVIGELFTICVVRVAACARKYKNRRPAHLARCRLSDAVGRLWA